MKNKINIFVAGHNGMVGSAIVQKLLKSSSKNQNLILKSRKDLDLTSQKAVKLFFKKNSIDQVYLSAAKVGGIVANNTMPYDFIYQNLMIQNNVINECFKNGVKKLLFLGSSCIYPRDNKQPIKETDLLRGFLEKTNEPYAIAKIAGIKMCQSLNTQFSKTHSLDYRCIMPTNLYGKNDNFDFNTSHVIPGLIAKFHKAKLMNEEQVFVWGTGKPLREFLYVDDLAEAAIKVMNVEKNKFYKNLMDFTCHINVGSNQEISIKSLAYLISETVGYEGNITFDDTKPDGTMRKLLDNSNIFNLGWFPKIKLKEGLTLTYTHFLKNNKLHKYN